MRARHLLFAAALATGCGGSPATMPMIDAPGTGQGDVAIVSNWLTVAARYGLMHDIAGAGATDTETNEWLPEFEGNAATAAELSRPHMAAADAAGNIYIADKEAHAIRKVTPSGTITTVAGTGVAAAADDSPGPATQRALANPNGLFVRADGTLYILDLDHGRIRKVTPDGTMSTLVTVPGGIAIGRGLWVDGADGSERVLFSSGSAVKQWTAASGVTVLASGFTSLGNIAMDTAADRLLVSDRGASRVYAVDLDGTKTPITGTLAGVRAVWPAHPDDGGGFFAGTHEGCQLWFIDTAGEAHLFVDGARNAHGGDGEPYNTPGKKLSELRSVTLDAAGNILIVDDDRGFVRRIARN